MSSIKSHISSSYINAANRLQGHKARRRIVAYVESYDDILFWRMALSELEDETRYFEVMLPTRNTLNKGKKQALISLMENGAGENMIACVDADYDYLLQGKTYQSAFLLNNPFVVHTYVYAIENFQCYAPSLHNVSVMATLNDHAIFDFREFLRMYSIIIFPLFIWNIMMYRRREYGRFTITDFNNVVSIRHQRTSMMMDSIEKLRHKVKIKIQELQRHNPGLKEDYLKTKESLLCLGVTPETTYLFVQGHHLFDNVVAPTLQTVCDDLRRERENEIRTKALHAVQMQNELSAYCKSQSDIHAMLKKNTGYMNSPLYRKMMDDLIKVVDNTSPAQSE